VSTDGGVTWSSPVTVDRRDGQFPMGWAPTSGTGIQMRSGPGAAHAARLLFAMDTLAYVLPPQTHASFFKLYVSLYVYLLSAMVVRKWRGGGQPL
jgi:hypothetical protein